MISSVTVTGWISKTRLADGSVIYRFGDSTGHFLHRRPDDRDPDRSHSMQFSAAGHGRAWLVGTGTYWANGHGPFPGRPRGRSTTHAVGHVLTVLTSAARSTGSASGATPAWRSSRLNRRALPICAQTRQRPAVTAAPSAGTAAGPGAVDGMTGNDRPPSTSQQAAC